MQQPPTAGWTHPAVGASFSWTQEAGPVVALENATLAVAQFTAPGVDEETLLRFRPVVTAGGIDHKMVKADSVRR